MKRLILGLIVIFLFVVARPWSMIALATPEYLADDDDHLLVWESPSLRRTVARSVAQDVDDEGDRLPTDNPPPLSRSCGGGTVPIDDYSQPVCCVNGYVFLNGQPISGADVTITANGVSVDLVTADPLGSGDAYYTSKLSGEPLYVEPGNIVTVRASFDGLVNEVSFEAAEGGQQVDVVLPQTKITSTWTRVNIPALEGAATSYDSQRESIYLFGGNLTDDTQASVSDGMWERKDSHWEPILLDVLPPARSFHKMIYVEHTQSHIVFSGLRENSGFHDDMWEWDGNSWNQLFPANLPTPRMEYAMAYDPNRNRVVLFGGRSGGASKFSDTWEWDGQNWIKMAPLQSPLGRYRHTLTYDPVRETVILFGGNTLYIDLADTWEWDGENWTQLFPLQSPLPRQAHQVAYNLEEKKMILYGGWGRDTASSSRQLRTSVWTWDGENWNQLSANSLPGARLNHTLTYDVKQKNLILYGGRDNITNATYLADTWILVDDIWMLDNNGGSELLLDTYLELAYDAANNSIVALSGSGEFQSWTRSQWIPKEPDPPFWTTHRDGFKLAGDNQGEFLLWGGDDNNGNYSNQTLFYKDGDWSHISTDNSPQGRTQHGLVYDKNHDIWLMFGGANNIQYFGDTWIFDGENWTNVANDGPAPRTTATMIYDENNGKILLFGGRSLNQIFNDVWEWNGVEWQEIIPVNFTLPPERYSHGAVFDRSRGVMVIAGGQNSQAVLQDTWEWNGRYWQPRATQQGFPLGANAGIVYDISHDYIWAMGGENVEERAQNGIYRHEVFSTPNDALPIGTISQIYPRDVRRNTDVITLKGLGADGDGSDVIVAYRWLLDGIEIGNTAEMTTTAELLTLGVHTIGFQVEDNEGNWSSPIQQTIYVRDDSGSTGVSAQPTWTLLLYVAADNDLDPWLGESQSLSGMLYRLKTSLPQDHVKVGVLYDGPDIDDTYRYVLNEDSNWSAEKVDEARMDDPTTLESFVSWGYDTFHSDYYALSLIDHANGIVGFGQDFTTNSAGEAFLTPNEIRSALEGATDDGARTIDVIHFDGCSFGLLENAAIVNGLAQYVVASPNTGWGIFAYDVYRREAGQAETPLAYATAVAQNYAAGLQIEGYPYTVSVMDMGQFESANEAVGRFGEALVTYIDEDVAVRRAEIRATRDESQKYDSVTPVLDIDVEDSYVDIVDFAQRVQLLGDSTLHVAAQTVLDAMIADSDPFIVYEDSQSGQFEYYDPELQENRIYTIDLDKANGLGVFYPPRFSQDATSAHHQYVNHRLFETTRDSGWTRFIANGLPPQLSFNPPPLSSNYLIEPLIVAGDTNDSIFMAINPLQAQASISQTFTSRIEVQSLDASFDGAAVALNFDPAVLQVEQVTIGGDLDIELRNQFDNSLGTIDVAVGTLGDPVTGTFTVAEVLFSPISATAGTVLTFTQSFERESGVTYNGHFLPIQFREGHVSVTSTTVFGQVTLQGRPTPPDARWQVPLAIRFYDSDTQQLRYQFDQTADSSGQVVLSGITSGVYDVTTVSPQMLATRTSVSINNGINEIDLGVLRAGDINNDNRIVLDDFSLLRQSFGLCDGNAVYDYRADLNGDLCVLITDFSLLAFNFNGIGQTMRSLFGDRETTSATLTLMPSSDPILVGETFSVTVLVDTESAVDSGAFYIKYDPQIITAISVDAGSQFTTILQNEIDSTSGVISFASGTFASPASSDFVLATIVFESKDATGNTTLDFLRSPPQLTDIAFQGYSVFDSADSLPLSIEHVANEPLLNYLPFLSRP